MKLIPGFFHEGRESREFLGNSRLFLPLPTLEKAGTSGPQISLEILALLADLKPRKARRASVESVEIAQAWKRLE